MADVLFFYIRCPSLRVSLSADHVLHNAVRPVWILFFKNDRRTLQHPLPACILNKSQVDVTIKYGIEHSKPVGVSSVLLL